MATLICNRGCKHEERWCSTSIEHDGCTNCDRDGEPTCDVGRFIYDNFADCQRRFSFHSCGHLTGFTRRAHAALVHLGDAANVADETNRSGVVAAITSLLSCRSIREELSFARKMVDDDATWSKAEALWKLANATTDVRTMRAALVDIDGKEDEQPPEHEKQLHELQLRELHKVIDALMKQRAESDATIAVVLTEIALRLASAITNERAVQTDSRPMLRGAIRDSITAIKSLVDGLTPTSGEVKLS